MMHKNQFQTHVNTSKTNSCRDIKDGNNRDIELREQTPNNWIIFTTYQYQKEDESTRKI